ncbi:MAG: GntR family transcriptional regulator [Stappiaceae bacterium]
MIRNSKGRLSKAELVYDCLRSEIIAGDRAPGDPLDKAELAARFDASRQPIANAMDRLAYEGLVHIVPQHGSFVSKLNVQEVFDRFFIRKALEVEFVMALASHITTEIVRQLDINLRFQAVALDAKDYEEFYNLDVRFHEIIHQQSPVAEAARILDQVAAHLIRARRLLLPKAGRGQKTLNEHEAILAALTAGDPQRAANAMRSHIDGVAVDFIDFAATRPDLFEMNNQKQIQQGATTHHNNSPAESGISVGRPT